MHSVASSAPGMQGPDAATGSPMAVRRSGAAGASRAAVPGATGYTGQELLRILSRHPGVSIAAAMSSGASGGAERRLPALAHLWNGEIAPFSAERLAAEADIVFLALPDKAAAEYAPRLVEAG